ncbi:hypothetical protein SAMN05444161_0138 [Rhizobiales bacterium GAS191]|nr:hypothetical protein SAMN05519103_07621 [Rhizobiales bacterium GAS113]SEB91700.1 hypothetical protein SAMN05444161_0138 [Rhizobiales bacterium GAS191]SED26317.1 hypothetical protein SAMN05519104_3170 [Rhizobiales bacterium GAS188]
MTRKLTAFFAAAAIFGGLAAGTTVFAKEAAPSPSSSQTEGKMGDQGKMVDMMGQMNPDQMKHMTQMIDGCNRMMKSASNAPTEPSKE